MKNTIKESLIKSILSFPRKRESSRSRWIPAFAGMTIPVSIFNQGFQKYLAIFALALCTRAAFGQPGFSESVTMHRRDSSLVLGRDFWFAPIQNNVDGFNKSINIYIYSTAKTTAYVESNGNISAVPILGGADTQFSVPVAWELKSSGVAENKGIHVYSSDADLYVSLSSYRHYLVDYATEGTYCIPAIGLGTDYVVAGFESYYDSTGPDDPSEFTITADKDNTEVQITPSCNLRQSNSATPYPKGVKFFVTLNRGQAVQYQAVLAQGTEGYDVTGTIIHSSNPVAVIGGAMLAAIPPGVTPSHNATFNYICDMIPPTRAWGNTYYTTNNIQQSGLTGHDSSLYCIVSSAANQAIRRYDCADGDHLVDTFGTAFDHKFVEEATANKWYSDQPFMLVQYFNSSAYPDGTDGNGDPSEVVMYPREGFAKKVVFQTPIPGGSLASADNYANIIVNTNDTSVYVNGGNLKSGSFPPECLDDTFEVYVLPIFSNGTNIVTSDSGCQVYLYGYLGYEPYSWFGSRLPWTIGSGDAIPPAITFTPGNLCVQASISDLDSSGLAEIILDTAANISFAVDTSFVPGSGDRTSNAEFCVSDTTIPGYLQFTVYDLAGNRSIGTITFTPSVITAKPQPGFTASSILAFDTVLVGTNKTLGVFTVTDTSQTLPITIDSLWTDDPAFTFDKLLAENLLPDTLAPGAQHTFSVTFTPTVAKTYSANAYALNDSLGARSDTISGIGYTVLQAVSEGSQTEGASPTMRAAITPNPAAESINLDFSIPQTGDVTFELSSIDGKTVLRWNGNAESIGEHLQSLDLSSLAAGDYIYSFRANGVITSEKLAIIR